MTEQVLADWFDGQSSRARPVSVRLESAELVFEGASLDAPMRYPVSQLQWPERTRAGSKVLKLPDGGSLHAHDDDAWTLLGQNHGVVESPVVTWQQSGWRIFASLILIVVLGAAIFRWGVPLAAQAILVVVPEQVDRAIGEQAFKQIDEQLFEPTELDIEVQNDLSERLRQMVAGSAVAAREIPPYTLEFRSSRFGPNAFALPGGTIVLTDELVELADGDHDMVLGVLAHELGHVVHRHGMRGVSQSLLGAILLAVVVGDSSSLIASAPLLLGSMAYTRDLEREADDHAIQMLRDNGISPAVMARFFRRIAQLTDVRRNSEDDATDNRENELGLLFSSHPGARERIRKFEEAALR
ncbi:MAG: M48 family metallopeptidase [Burkholderiaceae bacterium]